MSKYGVRRLGMAPCTEADYRVAVKREKLVKSGDKEALAKFDTEIAARRAKALKAKSEESGEGDN